MCGKLGLGWGDRKGSAETQCLLRTRYTTAVIFKRGVGKRGGGGRSPYLVFAIRVNYQLCKNTGMYRFCEYDGVLIIDNMVPLASIRKFCTYSIEYRNRTDLIVQYRISKSYRFDCTISNIEIVPIRLCSIDYRNRTDLIVYPIGIVSISILVRCPISINAPDADGRSSTISAPYLNRFSFDIRYPSMLSTQISDMTTTQSPKKLHAAPPPRHRRCRLRPPWFC